MEQILFIRESLISFFKRHESLILFLAKFFLGFIVFSFIASIDHPNPKLLKLSIPGILLILDALFATMFAVFPAMPAYALIVLYIGLHTSAVLEISVVIVLILICFLLFYVRLAPKESILIILTILAFYLHIPYFIPIFAGLYFTLMSIVPVTIGIFIWEFIPVVVGLLETSPTAVDASIIGISSSFASLYLELLNNLSVNNQWIFIAFIFAMVIIVVNLVSHLSIDYSKDIAISLGAVLIIVSFIIAVLFADFKEISIFSIIFFTLLSAVILLCIRFFDSVLDYSRAERVQFEDEENYYYVKIIPKLAMTKRNKVVKRIRPSVEDFDESLDEES